MKGLTKTKRFIADNKLDFIGVGSELNSNCTVLAGFICHICELHDFTYADGNLLIEKLNFIESSQDELYKVFDYAWYNEYEDFWSTAEAKEKYIF